MEERLRRVAFHHGLMSDACWHRNVRIDPGERLAMRTKQKVYLARYGRQDMFAWEHRELSELEAAFRALVELMRHENSLSRMGEDR